MTPKKLFRAFVFLAMLFVVLYVGMMNTHRVDFAFPLLLEKKVTQPAALLFFAVFAIGVVAGMALGGGGDSKPESGSAPKKSKK